MLKHVWLLWFYTHRQIREDLLSQKDICAGACWVWVQINTRLHEFLSNPLPPHHQKRKHDINNFYKSLRAHSQRLWVAGFGFEQEGENDLISTLRDPHPRLLLDCEKGLSCSGDSN